MEKYRFGFTSLCIGFYKYFSPNPNILYTMKQKRFCRIQNSIHNETKRFCRDSYILCTIDKNAFAEIRIFYAHWIKTLLPRSRYFMQGERLPEASPYIPIHNE